jgi:hypothetical protein
VTAAGATAPPATVLVCTRNRGELVGDCVRAIQASLREHDELLVVEVESDSTRELIDSLGDPRCRWQQGTRPGKCRQINDGVLAARGEVILLTDDDCIVAPGWVAAMAGAFLEQGVGIAFGPVHGLSSTPDSDGPPTAEPGPATAEDWMYSHGAAMGVSRRALEAVGGFDERLGPGTPIRAGEEADLLARMEAGGWRAWLVDAPVVEHVEWRSEAQELGNALAYEHGGGAWVGAALRRGPAPARRRIDLRLRYQAGHFRSGGSRGFAVRALLAFGSGVIAGARLAPTRFLDEPVTDDPATPPATGPAAVGELARTAIAATDGWEQCIEVAPTIITPGRSDIRHALPALPWPSVRGRRCLDLGSGDGLLAFELWRRGAGEVVAAGLAEPGETERFDLIAGLLGADVRRADPAVGDRFDVVTALGVLSAGDPHATVAAARRLSAGAFLSIEPIELPLTVAARRVGLARLDSPGGWSLNGAAHRTLLERGGFRIRNVSRIFVAHEHDGSTGRLQRRLTGDPAPGRPHRAILAVADR